MARIRLRIYDPRKHQDEKMNQQAIRVDEKRMHHTIGARRPYRGSTDEAEHRSGRRLPRRG